LLHFDPQLSPSSGGGVSSSMHFSWHVESCATQSLLHTPAVAGGFEAAGGGVVDDDDPQAEDRANSAGISLRKSTGGF